ncbi:hypothetical protein HDU77_006650 [Chytriomyces hyalinus]|nr:hypothetical protein HDU77_006650 [Chytriomyces hyalinus]
MRLFDMYLFTIEFSAGKYQVNVSEFNARVTAELQSYNGQVVVFPGDQDDWPAEEFLKHHNRTFNFRHEKLKAAAETGFMEKSDSTDTFTNDNLEENRDLSKLADDMWEESQTTSTFLSLE